MVAAAVAQAVSATARWRGVQFGGGHFVASLYGTSPPLRANAGEPGWWIGVVQFGSRSARRPPAPSGIRAGEHPIALAEVDAARSLSGRGAGATDTAAVAEICEGGPALQAILIRS